MNNFLIMVFKLKKYENKNDLNNDAYLIGLQI